jgi:hypothetical protein
VDRQVSISGDRKINTKKNKGTLRTPYFPVTSFRKKLAIMNEALQLRGHRPIP